MRNYLIILALAIFTLLPGVALACPAVHGIPDYNCDGMLQITVIGDSLVYGIGDTKNKNKGGYVLRLQKALPEASVQNLGVPGLRTFELLELLNRAYTKNKAPKTKAVLNSSDVIIFDLGRNDIWIDTSPEASYKNLEKASSIIRKKVKQSSGTAPIIVTAVLMLPNRGSQSPWVQELNSLIEEGNTISTPADLRFNLVSKRLLSSDRIHPTSKGYDALAKTLLKYVTKTLPKKIRTIQKNPLLASL
jgi:lysophospholipase L1-like esterase